jgi:thioredoxin-like negative regulator of GroEL
MSCLTAKPVVNGIEEDLEGTARVIRLDIASDRGKKVAGRYGVDAVPTIVVLDGEGEVAHRESGVPDREEVVSRATAVA